MPDLDAAIRAKLAEYDASMSATGSLWGAEEMRDALTAVLELHADAARALPGELHCGELIDWVDGGCPTVRTIAEKLGISPTT